MMDKQIAKEVSNHFLSMDNPILLMSKIGATVIAGIISALSGLMLDNYLQFVAVVAVIFGDSLFGIWAAIKERKFETKRALKVFYYLVGYNVLLAIILVVEKAYPVAFFLSEAVILPLLLFQFMSMLKNASRAGIISSKLLDKILKNIDAYKDGKLNNIPDNEEEEIS